MPRLTPGPAPDLAALYTADWFRERTYFRGTYRQLAAATAKVLAPSCILELGCGAGYLIEWFLEQGIETYGFDGSSAAREVQAENVRAACDACSVADLREPLDDDTWLWKEWFDLIICIEVAEHIEERHLPAFFSWFEWGSQVLLTAAPPGQRGLEHVNCRPPDYWIGAFAAIGLAYDEALTAQWKAVARPGACPWVHRNAMIFTRRDEP